MIKCKVHPTYKGKVKPRILCSGCWFVFYYYKPIDQTDAELIWVEGGR